LSIELPENAQRGWQVVFELTVDNRQKVRDAIWDHVLDKIKYVSTDRKLKMEGDIISLRKKELAVRIRTGQWK